MEQVKVTLKQRMPMLMHADNIDWADLMAEWQKDPGNKGKSKAGDDRTPAWRWIGCLNYDDPKTGVVTIPAEYIMRCIMEGAAQVPVGRGAKTFKSQSQSGLLCDDFHWPMLVRGKPIKISDILPLREVKSFAEHVELVQALGFSLFTKRVRIGNAKHVRVRPRFDNWSATGTITILDDSITKTTLARILEISGAYKGLGDWRPGGPTPGQWGTFEAEVA